jgi:hypothetical protein
MSCGLLMVRCVFYATTCILMHVLLVPNVSYPTSECSALELFSTDFLAIDGYGLSRDCRLIFVLMDLQVRVCGKRVHQFARVPASGDLEHGVWAQKLHRRRHDDQSGRGLGRQGRGALDCI